MEIKSTPSFNAIPDTLIRVFLTCKLYCKYPIYSFNYISFLTIVNLIFFYFIYILCG